MQMPLETSEEKSLKLVKIVQEKSLYRVFFGNGRSLLCSEDDIFEYQLYKDAVISDDDFNELSSKNNYFECLNDGIRIINIKQYSIKQVYDKLVKLEYDTTDINQVIDYLKSINVLNDDDFYISYVDFKIRQGYGPLYIKNKLYDLGINRSVEIDYDKQYDMIKQKYLKKHTINDSKSVFVKKFKAKMVNQGYNKDIINDVIANEVIDSNDDAIKKDYYKLLNKYEKKYEGYKLSATIKQKMIAMGYCLSEIEQLMEEGLQ